MRKIFLSLALAFLLMAALLSLIRVAYGQGPDEPDVISRETQGENVREIYAPLQIESPQQPNIGFIDSPTATCYQPDSTQDACYINWYYLSVNADPNYMIAMTVTLNAIGVVARLHGFFQTSMYAPYSLFDRGFKVACGALGSGGSPTLGMAYSWTINARDSANLKSANYGTVYCPAYTP
ncbi:MAG: hypothetical protein QME21_16995 [Anaerolineales bacterium]|jgi:hypothetical protein|nr:hypothetical protein [Anaerolineales bacterium]